MDKHWIAAKEDRTAIWIVIAPTRADAIKKFCDNTHFPETDFFGDAVFTMEEETPIC